MNQSRRSERVGQFAINYPCGGGAASQLSVCEWVSRVRVRSVQCHRRRPQPGRSVVGRGRTRLRIAFFARDRVTLQDRHDSLLVVQDEPGRGSRSRRQAPGTYLPTSSVVSNSTSFSAPFLIGHSLCNCSICRRCSPARSLADYDLIPPLPAAPTDGAAASSSA